MLVPAYNEEKVIERTVRSVLDSDYPNLRVIVIDDGSSDATLEVARAAFARRDRRRPRDRADQGRTPARPTR